MIEIGSTVKGRIVRLEPYGLYLKCDGATIVVLAPEISWTEKGDFRPRFALGEEIDVQVLRRNYKTDEWVGSIRRLQQDRNPYRELSRLPPGQKLTGTVVSAMGDQVVVELSNGAWGLLARNAGSIFQRGDPIDVEIATLEVDDGRMTFDPARPESRGANKALPVPALDPAFQPAR